MARRRETTRGKRLAKSMEADRAASPLHKQRMQRQRQTNPLPQEMILGVLLRLPGNPLMRFKAVSKDWLSWISDPQFMIAHSHHNPGAQSRYGLTLWKSESTFYSVGDKGSSSSLVPLDGIGMHDYYCPDLSTILGQCNGLYFGLNADKNAYIWNPTTHKYLEIPSPPRLRERYSDYLLCALLYCSSTDDYKAIMALFPHKNSSTCAYVLSFKTRTWQISRNNYPEYYTSENRPRPAVLDGTPHWGAVCGDYVYGCSRYAILCFDVVNKMLKEFPSPPSVLDWGASSFFQVGIMGGKELCAFYFHRGCITVWAMKEHWVKESWTQLFVVPGCSLCLYCLFTPSHELLLARREPKFCKTLRRYTHDVRKVILYDPKQGTDREVSIPPEIPSKHCLTLEESLEWIPTCSSGDWMEMMNPRINKINKLKLYRP